MNEDYSFARKLTVTSAIILSPPKVREGQSLMAVKVDYEQVLGHIRRTISKNGMPYYKIVSARSPYGLALTNTVGNLHHKGCLVGDAGLGRTTIYEYDLVKDLKLTPGSNDGGSILVALCSDGVKDVLQAADIARFAGGVERAVLHLVVHEMETAAAAAKAAVLSSFRSSSLFGIRGIGNNSSTAPSSISIHDLETEPIELMVKRLMRGYSSDRFDSKACQDLTDIIIKESEYDGLITISDTSINSIINQDVSTTCNNIAATNNSASCSTASLSSASSSHDLNDLCHAVISLAVLRKSYDDVSMIVVEISGCDLPCTKEALTKQQPTRQQTDGGSDSMVILETDAEAATAAAIALATAANICEIDQGSPMMGVTDLKGTLSPPSLSKVTVHSRGSSALPSAILLGTGGVQPNVSGEEEGDEVTSSNVLEKGLAVDGKEVSLSSLDEVGSTSQGDAEPNLCESGILELSRAPPASSFTSVAAVAASDSPIIPSTTTSDTFAYPMYIPPHPPLLDTKTCMLPSLPALLCENMQSSSTNDPMMMEQITYQSPPADVVPPTVEPDTTATSSDVVVDGSIGRHVSWAAKPTSAASLSYSSLSTLETTIATTLPASPLLPPLLKTAPIITDHCVVGIGMDTDENVMSVISMEKGCAIGTGQQQESEAVTYILNSVANSSNSAAASNSAISVLQQLQRFFPISQAPTISSTTQPLFTATASSTPMIPEPLDLPLSSMDSSPEIASAAEPMCISTIKDSSTAIAAATVATLAPTPSTYTTTACNSNVSPTSSLKRDSRAVSGIEATSQDERDEETGSISEISGLEEESSSVPSSSLARDQTLLSPMKKQKDDSLKNQTLNISP